MLLGTSISGSHVFPPLPCLCRLLLLAVVLCSWTCRSYEVANTWIWRLRAGHRSAKQAMGVSGACAGCWWVQRRQTGHFLRHAADGRQERQGRGERELPRTEGDARATSQAKTSSCTPSIRRSATPFTTSTSSSAPSRSRSPRAQGVLGAHLLGAAENAMLGTFAPSSSQRMLRSHPQLTLPIHPLPQAARNTCQPPPSVSGSC